MVPIVALWLPILLSAVIVFVISSILHMVFPYHRSDFAQVPNEDDVMDSLGKFTIPPGEYVIPFAGSSKERSSPEFLEKMKKGPLAFMTVMTPGPPAMGKSLGQWFLYSVVVGIFAAYVVGRLVGPGADSVTIFRFTGAIAFAGYTLALWQNSIWYKRKWSTTLKSTFDGLLYSFGTGAAFAWLWPS